MEELDDIRSRADALGLEGDERDDYITSRMARHGYKKGPGEWIKPEDDDSPQDDDDEPVTRGEIRRMDRERRKRAQEKGAQAPPKKEKNDEKPAKKATRDPWWD